MIEDLGSLLRIAGFQELTQKETSQIHIELDLVDRN
jgi:hypothetical protein